MLTVAPKVSTKKITKTIQKRKEEGNQNGFLPKKKKSNKYQKIGSNGESEEQKK